MSVTTKKGPLPWEVAAAKNVARTKLERETEEQLQEIDRHIAATHHALCEYMAEHKGRGRFGVDIAARLREVAALAGALAYSVDGHC